MRQRGTGPALMLFPAAAVVFIFFAADRSSAVPDIPLLAQDFVVGLPSPVSAAGRMSAPPCSASPAVIFLLRFDSPGHALMAGQGGNSGRFLFRFFDFFVLFHGENLLCTIVLCTETEGMADGIKKKSAW